MQLLLIYGEVLDVGCGSGEFARFVKEDKYLGFDIDEQSLFLAKNKFPNHKFTSQLPLKVQKFDTVISMAVIEHAPDPVDFLKTWSGYLKSEAKSKFVLTTPHPRIEVIHVLGAKLGLFSKHGNEEHKELIDYKSMKFISNKAGLKILTFKKFLLGMNQLFVLSVP